ncbi:uncharacterized protein LOC110434342 [Sorghum bicolor]|uniref:uncharacterized protein LOC110434342 n=1 Tax=Sorghum bicolor TaxID=4558 RepID=UPI000B42609C|nr:uncharacterized protein LOC110434342 [Sorghum bicolor]|eukprot:XP_021313878.1 uncharacterized protein LOC110434342 [Sorghum bicolor]
MPGLDLCLSAFHGIHTGPRRPNPAYMCSCIHLVLCYSVSAASKNMCFRAVVFYYIGTHLERLSIKLAARFMDIGCSDAKTCELLSCWCYQETSQPSKLFPLCALQICINT